jgi:hypothetical protein
MAMRKVVLATLVLACAARADASGTGTRLTPANLGEQPLRFLIQVADWGEGKIVTIQAEDRAKRAAPVITVAVQLYKGDEQLFGCDAAVTRVSGAPFRMAASFYAAPRQLDGTKVWVEHRVQGAPSGSGGYWFYPKDFVVPGPTPEQRLRP